MSTYIQRKIESLQEALTKALKSNYCDMPDFMNFLIKDASSELTLHFLRRLFESSKFLSREENCERKYGKNFKFAFMAYRASSRARQLIAEDKPFNAVWMQIADDYSNGTRYIISEDRYGCGVYRGSCCVKPNDLVTPFGNYNSYNERLLNIKKRHSPYSNFTLTKIDGNQLVHPSINEVFENLKIITNRYEFYRRLVRQYKENTYSSIFFQQEANDIISEIYYLMANTCPFYRGTNGICDILMRSQYFALDINQPHIKAGVGLDLESFCLDMREFQRAWVHFFEQNEVDASSDI